MEGMPVEKERNTKEASMCLDKCLESVLEMIPDVDPRADLKWYLLVDEHAPQLLEENGTLTADGKEIADEVCGSIIPHALPAWKLCSLGCSEFDAIYAESASKYAEYYLPQSCSNPEKFLHAQICLQQVLDEVDNSSSFIEKMREVIAEKLGFKEIEESSSKEFQKSVMKIAKESVVGPKGMLCERFSRVLDRIDDLELCGWTKEALLGMINNKISRAAILNDFPFTRIEDCSRE
ncbi:hypothetical protein FO519_007470 [Halicephalobus sp. NKZ332]|nr:hypothetical protein FO519_007470 [Halicephalobus sp. NKZ332]